MDRTTSELLVRYKARDTSPAHVTQPNQLWCADHKDEFILADRRYCYPLTITDYASRYLITCRAKPPIVTASLM
jgi:putative transposase